MKLQSLSLLQHTRVCLKQGKVDVAMMAKEAQFYMAELIVALRFLHSKDIVHRDLKPENILVMANGHLKLTDFGTALDTTAGEGVKDFVGTPEFVSPEVLKDEPATVAADMWGVGVILYQLLTGRMPFSAPSEWLIFEVFDYIPYLPTYLSISISLPPSSLSLSYPSYLSLSLPLPSPMSTPHTLNFFVSIFFLSLSLSI